MVDQETTAARVLRDPCLLRWVEDIVTTAACMLRGPCILNKGPTRVMALTTTVAMTAIKARALSIQMLLGPQWAAHMTRPMAPCPITHTMAMAWDPCLTMAHMDLTDTAMEWDPCLTTALMMAQWDPCQTKAHMEVQMEAHMRAHMEALVEMEEMTACPWATRCRIIGNERKQCGRASCNISMPGLLESSSISTHVYS